jgi:hypothetical protein
MAQATGEPAIWRLNAPLSSGHPSCGGHTDLPFGNLGSSGSTFEPSGSRIARLNPSQVALKTDGWATPSLPPPLGSDHALVRGGAGDAVPGRPGVSAHQGHDHDRCRGDHYATRLGKRRDDAGLTMRQDRDLARGAARPRRCRSMDASTRQTHELKRRFRQLDWQAFLVAAAS